MFTELTKQLHFANVGSFAYQIHTAIIFSVLETCFAILNLNKNNSQ